MVSRPAKAETSISADLGRWKLVISIPTALKRYAGVMKMPVAPDRGDGCCPQPHLDQPQRGGADADDAPALTSRSAAAVLSETWLVSRCIQTVSSAFTGRKAAGADMQSFDAGGTSLKTDPAECRPAWWAATPLLPRVDGLIIGAVLPVLRRLAAI
jgi:hypothetical protein